MAETRKYAHSSFSSLVQSLLPKDTLLRTYLGCYLMRTIANFIRYTSNKLHKQPCKSRFIANSSTCTTTELSVLLTSCLTAIKNNDIEYCTTVYERNGKKIFWSIKNSGEILNKLKFRGFLAAGLSTYDFSTLYTTLPHNLIKEKHRIN